MTIYWYSKVTSSNLLPYKAGKGRGAKKESHVDSCMQQDSTHNIKTGFQVVLDGRNITWASQQSQNIKVQLKRALIPEKYHPLNGSDELTIPTPVQLTSPSIEEEPGAGLPIDSLFLVFSAPPEKHRTK